MRATKHASTPLGNRVALSEVEGRCARDDKENP